MTQIKVRIVDDSAVVRQVALEADSGIEVIAAVADPWFAIDRMKLNWPDVIVLDIEMPRMGDDGARGLREMHEAGASTVAEEESICLIFGMPKEAIKRGGVDKVVPPRLIPREIVAFSPIPVLR